MIILTCLFLSLVSHSRSTCEDHTAPHVSAEIKLHNDLFKNYNSEQTTKNVTVKLKFRLRTYQFVNDEEEFVMGSWVYLSWHDDCLTWSPADYDGIKNTQVSRGKIWSPLIALDDERFQLGFSYAFQQKCSIYSSGLVSCFLKATDAITCNSVLSNWPYDTQTCTFMYTVLNNAQLKYMDAEPLVLSGAQNETEWIIVAYGYTHPEDLEDKLSISLIVEREAVLLAAINVVPLIVVAVLSVAALFVDVRSNLRVYMQCFCLACEFMLMQTINENIPNAGRGTPTLLKFLRSSLLLSALSVVLTYCFKNLRKRTKPSPPLVILINDFILKDSRDRFIWPKWEAECHEDKTTEKSLEQWNCLSYVLNFCLLVISVVVNFIWFVMYIPRPIPVTIYLK